MHKRISLRQLTLQFDPHDRARNWLRPAFTPNLKAAAEVARNNPTTWIGKSRKPEEPPIRSLGGSNHPQEFAGFVKDVVPLSTHVTDDRRSVSIDDVAAWPPELSGPVSRRAEAAREFTGTVEHKNPQIVEHQAAEVEDIQIAALVEGHPVHCAEHLPWLPVDYAHPEDLGEVGVQGPVLPGQLHGFLGA